MEESRAITRKSASNLALAFVLLPKAKRDGMSALYAFCREVATYRQRSHSDRRSPASVAAWRADIASPAPRRARTCHRAGFWQQTKASARLEALLRVMARLSSMFNAPAREDPRSGLAAAPGFTESRIAR